MFWSEIVMLLLEFLVAVCTVTFCGPCLLAVARRLLAGDELLQRQGRPSPGGGSGGMHEADVVGCEEPSCPYYKKNIKYLMVPAARRRLYNSPTRH